MSLSDEQPIGDDEPRADHDADHDKKPLDEDGLDSQSESLLPEDLPVVSSGRGVPLADRPTETSPSEIGQTAVYETDDPSFAVTGDFSLSESADDKKSSSVFDSVSDKPVSLGRYTIERELGAGGFGRVFLAVDTQLHRRVAIKVPHKNRVARPVDIERFLDEARTLASLDHPGVVPIYDFDRIEDRCYVVSKFIDGETLADRIKRSPLSVDDTVRMLLTIAEILQFIHLAGVVHRDVKPANLLLDQAGNCFITDFGLALRDNSYGKDRGRIGTVIYMSPEQARGEGHLVDGRSDLFSVGVMMYEMLTGQLPFMADSWQEVVLLICNQEPRPLRGHNPKIPKELERICLRLLSKRAADRYLIADDLVEDLEHFIRQGDEDAISVTSVPTGTRPQIESHDQLVGIVPRGLRSFDHEDATYFRELLPGTRDRDGLPDSLRFWRRRIESDDPLTAFRVGVIYGSSGSGKSSFVNAGLLPTLDPNVTVISLEATGNRTELQLLSGLRKRVFGMPKDLDLVESLAWVRRSLDGQVGRKVLIVIDQFEQWLHAHGNDLRSDLILALRQCDGQHLQCLLLVRDDFWIGVSRFVDQLEVDLVRSHNLAMVDLFDKRHARKVLAEYGRGYSRLPDNLSDLSLSQNQFLDQAIEGLADEGKIIPVQLVTFAEIMKSREWTVRSLQELGGIEGVGIRFLEESLGASAPAENRSHELAAQAILKSLLPEAGTDIKGAMRSESELREISGYQSEPKRLAKLLTILDTDLRLITPTDPDSDAPLDKASGQRYYQLTHDYLVPAVRQWLQYRQQLTFSGRAAMRLADRADVWKSRPDKKHLPSWGEWAMFQTLTQSSRWSDPERRMMFAATKQHSRRMVVALFAIVAVGWGGYELWGRSRAQLITEQLSVAEASQVSGVIDKLQSLRGWSKTPLTQLRDRLPIDEAGGLHGRLGLLRVNPSDNGLFKEVATQSLKAELKELPLIRDELSGHRGLPNVVQQYWSVLNDTSRASEERFRSALMLMSFDPPQVGTASVGSDTDSKTDSSDADGPPQRWIEHREFVTEEVIRQTIRNPKDYLIIVESISKVAPYITPELRRVFMQPGDSTQRQKVASLLVDLWSEEPAQLADIFLDSDVEQVDAFVEVLDTSDLSQMRSVLDSALRNSPTAQVGEQEQQHVSNRQVNAAAYLLRRGVTDSVWPLLRHDPIPNTRSGLIHRIKVMEVDPRLLIERLSSTQLSSDPRGVESGLMLALGSLGRERVKDQQVSQGRLIARQVFSDSADPDVHSAAEWLLQQFDDRDWVDTAINKLREKDVADLEAGRARAWSINSRGQTMVRFESRSSAFQLSSTEVTVEQFLDFRSGHSYKESQAPDLRCPMIQVTWSDAVEYCQWLTLEEGLGDEEQCYVAVDGDEHGWSLKPDYVEKLGYRLPLSTEWEAACRGDAVTRLPFGYDASIVQEYGWTLFQSAPSVMPVKVKKPLPTGMHGMLGNVTEWCTDLQGSGQKLRAVRGPRCNAYLQDVLDSISTGGFNPETRFFSLGFRVARSAAKQ
ncbi:bifunctional serine/threonine-protein kinase/formylglycine-generating enzyme family protein [Stieleria varia]|uniref:Serine/threonine-protein kinase PrkC n=1 Tax=Stieleria varia TaxID=2528005 RepID=A0A5C6AHL9_9BACT|nr:bifunctional serine/threonine-protein kinase/formylglycine-generating enzyme family protein [Stieleria varia]TWT98685.1 Serine/threonine-protein kinase PrkC [Stieleria varia]